jgi:hypothetical protein
VALHVWVAKNSTKGAHGNEEDVAIVQNSLGLG